MNNKSEHNEPSLHTLLKRLEHWRHLPAYQLERRVDVLLSFILPEIVKTKIHHDQDPILTVVPEFPLHMGEVFGHTTNKNRSIKVDFAVFSQPEKRIILVELKTDNSSIKLSQLEDMQLAKSALAENLLNGVIECARNTPNPRKYAHLIWMLHKEIGCIDVGERFKDMDLSDPQPGLTENFKTLDVAKSWATAKICCWIIFPGGCPMTQSSKDKVDWVRKQKRWLTSVEYFELKKELGKHPLASFLGNLSEFEAGRSTLFDCG